MTFIRNPRNLPDPIMPNSLDAALQPFVRKTAVGETVEVVWQHKIYTALRNDARDNRVQGSYFSKFWGLVAWRHESSTRGEKYTEHGWKMWEFDV